MKLNNFEDTAHNTPDNHGSKPGWKTYLAFAILFIFLFMIGWGYAAFLKRISHDRKAGPRI